MPSSSRSESVDGGDMLSIEMVTNERARWRLSLYATPNHPAGVTPSSTAAKTYATEGNLKVYSDDALSDRPVTGALFESPALYRADAM
jgi:hypothetical protein